MYTAGNIPGMRTTSNGALRGQNWQLNSHRDVWLRTKDSKREKRNVGINTDIKSR